MRWEYPIGFRIFFVNVPLAKLSILRPRDNGHPVKSMDFGSRGKGARG